MMGSESQGEQDAGGWQEGKLVKLNRATQLEGLSTRLLAALGTTRVVEEEHA